MNHTFVTRIRQVTPREQHKHYDACSCRCGITYGQWRL